MCKDEGIERGIRFICYLFRNNCISECNNLTFLQVGKMKVPKLLVVNLIKVQINQKVAREAEKKKKKKLLLKYFSNQEKIVSAKNTRSCIMY